MSVGKLVVLRIWSTFTCTLSQAGSTCMQNTSCRKLTQRTQQLPMYMWMHKMYTVHFVGTTSWQYNWVTLRVSTHVFHLQKDCPSGELSRKKFLAIYSSLFPEGKAGAFYQHVFRTFDADGSGRIDFKEFLQVISAHFPYMYIHVGTCIRYIIATWSPYRTFGSSQQLLGRCGFSQQ